MTTELDDDLIDSVVPLALPLVSRNEEESHNYQDDTPCETQGIPIEVESMMNLVNVAQGRCGLLAGFSYYELSRQSKDNVDRVPAYALCLLGSFTFAVVAAAVTTFLRINIRRVRRDQWKEFETQTACVSYFVYTCFIASSLLWVCAQALMAQVYHSIPDSVMLCRLMEIAVPACLFGLVGLLFITYVLFLFGVTKFTAHRAKIGYCPYTGLEATDVYSNLLAVCTSTSDRTMYLLGFTGAGIARYQLALIEGDDWQMWLNLGFRVLINVAGAILSFVMLCGTHTVAILPFIPESRRDCVCRNLQWIGSAFAHLLNFGTMLVVLSSAVVGWGCSQSCHTKSMDMQNESRERVCYAEVAVVPAILGCIAIPLCMILYLQVRRCQVFGMRGALAEAPVVPDPSPTPFQGSMDGESLLAIADGWAGQASLFSGFVYYNLVCFDTDILHAPITAPFDVGVTPLNTVFLAVTMSAFAFGITVVILAGAIRQSYQGLPVLRAQELFTMKVLPVLAWAGTLHRLSMFTFMASFALLGLSKMVPFRPETLIVTSIGFFIIMSAQMKIKESYIHASDYEGTLDDLGDWISPSEGAAYKMIYPRAMAQMKAIAPQALFFGAFAYNGVNFLFRPESAVAPSYAISLSVCFIMALGLVVCEGSIAAYMAKLSQSEVKREMFARSLGLQIRYFWHLYRRVFEAFMVSIVLMGAVKLWSFIHNSTIECKDHANGERLAPRCHLLQTDGAAKQDIWSWQYGWVVSLGGVVGLVISWACYRMISSKAHQIIRSRHHIQRDPMQEPFTDVKEDIQIRVAAATFQTGNVFYEVLFTVINDEHVVESFWYLSFSVITLCLGCIAVVLASTLLFYMDDFPCKRTTNHFANAVLPSVTILYGLYNASLYTWLLAMIASSTVKYDSHWYFSLGTSIIALLLISIAGCIVRRTRENLPAIPESTRAASLVAFGHDLAQPVREQANNIVSPLTL